ncbi:hypothetical protein Ancab_021073 [Ancistrocladus abbreviatus]
MSDLEESMNSLNNPSFISRILSILEIPVSSQAHRFCKYGALLLVLVYAFSSVAYRIKFLFLQRRASKSSSSEALLPDYSDDEIYSDDEEEDDVDEEEEESSSSSEDESDERKSSYQNLTKFEEDYRVAGSTNLSESEGQNSKFTLRRRRSGIGGGDGFSFSELLDSKSVVKLFDDSSSDGNTKSIFSLAAVAMSSPAVIVSASGSENGGKLLGVNAWDMRMRRRIPAIHAEWRPRESGTGTVVGVNAGGVDKIYVRDDLCSDLVGDMRKVNSPLEDVTEYDEETWWDAGGAS